VKPGDLMELRDTAALIDPRWRRNPEMDDPLDTAVGDQGDLVVLVQPRVSGQVHLILHPVHGLREIYTTSLIPAVQR
jgi:hypothetical protein